MTPGRHARFLAGLVVLAGATLASPGASALAQSPSPSATGPIDGAAILDRALAGLGALLSYRLENRATNTITGDAELTTTLLDVNSPSPAQHYTMAVDGEVGVEWIVTLDDAWISTYGGAFRTEEDAGWSVSELEVDGMVLSTLQKVVSEGLVTELVGPDTIDGRATMHYRAHTIDPLITPPPDDYYRRTMTGTLDLWVDAAQGFLVRSELDMRQHDDYASDFGLGDIVMHEVATVSAVDDPANVVEAPDLALATRPPGQAGDPALAPTVRAAFDALDALDSYRITSVGETMGSETRRDITVVNTPEPAISWVMEVFGNEFMAAIRIGDQEWSRGGGTGDWSVMTPGDGQGGDDPWTARDFLGATGVLANAATFTVVEDGELLDGVATLHLRSTAGGESPETGWIPGTQDLWIAKDGGHLLRVVTDGQAVGSDASIGGIDDPANVIVAPSPVLATEAPS